MSDITVHLASGKDFIFNRNPLGSGKEKVAFPSIDGQNVICFFKSDLQNYHQRKLQIADLVGDYFNPTKGKHGYFWSEHFCWPYDYCTDTSSLPTNFFSDFDLHHPALAVVSPRYAKKFYMQSPSGRESEKRVRWFSRPQTLESLPVEMQGTRLNLLKICTWIARSIRKLHSGGIIHTDLSSKNVLIDPSSGSMVIIDLDSVSIKGKYAPVMAGSKGYQAPELVSGRIKEPTMETDLFALAVLIYEILFKRHPIEGKRTFGKEAAEDDRLIHGEKALFVEHPTDASNPPENNYSGSYKQFGKYLADCIERAFVTGLHEPKQRPKATEWELALYKTLELLHPTQDKQDYFVVKKQAEIICPNTNRRFAEKIPMATFYRSRRNNTFSPIDRCLVIFDHLRLEIWHILDTLPYEGTDRTPQGLFLKKECEWWLRNDSEHIFETEMGVKVQKGSAFKLYEGAKINMSVNKNSLMLRFEFIG